MDVLYYYPQYKNFDDLEASLTKAELFKMHEKAYEKQMDEKRFTAALKGIDLDEGKTSKFEEVKRRAEAKAMGMSEEAVELDGLFSVTEE